MDEITACLPGLSPVENKELCVRFDGGRLSSDGGVLVLREIEKRLGLAARLAGCLSDARDPASTTHSYADMIGARMFALACGYEDCDDLDVLRFDPAFKLACGRLPESGRDLMSQPTLSRLENAPSWRELARMGLTMIDLFCDSFERVPQRIVLDIDDTPDAVHGGQQLALFNAHYDEYCFQPIHIFDAATAKPVLSLLRPGKRPSGDEAARVLRHVIGRIRRHWPPGRDRGAWRRPLRHARGHGPAGGSGPRLHSRASRQRPAERDRPAVVRGRGAAPGAIRQGQGAPFLSRPATRPKAGHASARSLPASRPPQGGRMSASSSPTCRAAPNCSTRGSVAPVAGWKT